MKSLVVSKKKPRFKLENYVKQWSNKIFFRNRRVNVGTNTDKLHYNVYEVQTNRNNKKCDLQGPHYDSHLSEPAPV